MELFLHYSGLRVYSSKEQGAFCKTTSVDHFLGSLTPGRLDPDRRIRIWWSRERGRETAAARVAGVLFRGGGLTGDGQSGTSGFGSACGFTQEHERDMRKPLGPLARGCRVCGSTGTRRSGFAVAVLAGVRIYAALGNVLGCERDRKLACNTTNLTGVTLCDYGTAGGLRHGGGALSKRRFTGAVAFHLLDQVTRYDF